MLHGDEGNGAEKGTKPMGSELRKKAEEVLRKNPLETPTLSTAEVQGILHELDVHQIELQMQNREMRKVQEELARSRDAYAELFDFAPVGYLIVDFESRILDANVAAVTMLGAEREKLKGRTLTGFVHPDFLTAWEEHRRLVVERMEKHGEDVMLQRDDGGTFSAHIECAPRPEAGHCLVTLTDLTDRMEAEESLRKSEQRLVLLILQLEQLVDQRSAQLGESEEKYRKVFESEKDAIMIFDAETRQFVDVNKAAEEMYGYSCEEFRQLRQPDISAEPEASDASIRATLNGKITSVPQRLHLKKDGTVFPVEITGCSFLLDGRRVLCAVIRDITQRMEHEKEINRHREELSKLTSELSLAEQRERDRIARELHDGVSQLLSSSFLRLSLLKESELPPAARESATIICGILEQALEQTRSLTFELSCPMLSELGLAAALEELCSTMSHERNILIEFDGGQEGLPLTMDQKTVLYRSTRELLNNVLKHSGAQWARVQMKRKGAYARISVEDDGRGFDASTAGKGFSPSGGFGLFNMSEYLRHAGGELNVESSPGGGTEVVLTMPLEEDDG